MTKLLSLKSWPLEIIITNTARRRFLQQLGSTPKDVEKQFEQRLRLSRLIENDEKDTLIYESLLWRFITEPIKPYRDKYRVKVIACHKLGPTKYRPPKAHYSRHHGKKSRFDTNKYD